MYKRRFYFLMVCLFLPAAFISAQLCTGTLGDPIVNVTFGTQDEQLKPFVTTFGYAGGCPEPGEYTINNFLFGCGARYPNPYGTWVKMTGDHTGDVGGDYMLVNAENNAGLVHIDTAKGLCANITYQYASWITSVMRLPWTCDGHPILPELVFSIHKLDGTLLATYSTGEIPITDEKLWKQYGVSYVNPPGVDAVILKLEAKAPYGCGNGFAVDDITFQQCSPVKTSVTINGTPGPVNVCADYQEQFNLKGVFTEGIADPVTIWQNSFDTGKTWNDIPGETTDTYQVPHRSLGVILYRMEVASRANINSVACRIPSNVIYTEIHPVIPHKAPQFIKGCVGQDLVMPEADPKALSIEWTGSNGFRSEDYGLVIPEFKYSDTGLYQLQENFYFGCVTLDTFYVNAFPGIKLSVEPPHPICEGMSETLTATASADGIFKWVPADGLSNDAIPNPVAKPKDSTVYKVTVSNASGCKDSAELPLYVYRNPVAQAGPDKFILAGDTAVLNGSVKGTAISYYWSPVLFMDDNHSLHPNVFPPEETVYRLNVSSSLGCGTVADEVKVRVFKDIQVPNAFTPNGDGINDQFHVIALDNYKLKKFVIYDRGGSLIFHTDDIHKGWDGKLNGNTLPMTTYVYYIVLQSNTNRNIELKGTVLLIR